MGHALIEAEDLIPVPVAVEAARRYLRSVCDLTDDLVLKLTDELVVREYSKGVSLFDATSRAIGGIDEGLHIEKVGFARTVLEVVNDPSVQSPGSEELAIAVKEFAANMRALFRKLRQMQRDAERELTTERVSRRVERAKQSFLQDHPTGARREHAFVLLEEIEASLDGTRESDLIRAEISGLRRDFKIEDDVTEPVPDYDRFRERLEKLTYAGRLATQESESAAFGAATIADVADKDAHAQPQTSDDTSNGEIAAAEIGVKQAPTAH